jgi:hypothetical protein
MGTRKGMLHGTVKSYVMKKCFITNVVNINNLVTISFADGKVPIRS